MPTCRKCGAVKTDAEFKPRKWKTISKVTKSRACAQCIDARDQAYRDRNKKRQEERNKKHYTDFLHLHRAYYQTNKDRLVFKSRQNLMKAKFGMTIADRDVMLALQGGKCLICQTTEPKGKGWCIDHCHVTNKIRGILCVHCNAGLGMFRDSPDVLRTAAKYLEK